ncbi:hypothetical protein OA339_00205 [Candidatus Pelagibacter sp.]|nr:hypothetical protein [Candidatus Pelagibacter sp.]
MKILRLLNKNFYFILLYLFLGFNSLAEDQPADIWNIEKKKIDILTNSNELNLEREIESPKKKETSIYNMQSQNINNIIKLDQALETKEIEIIGLYDPDDYDLDINMWSNSDGDQLKNIFLKLEKLKLSNDAKELMNISMMTNAFSPQKNISKEEFLEFKTNWLIKNADLNLIENYLIKNQIINSHTKLTKYFLDENLSMANIDEACKLLKKNLDAINDEYISKYNIYCLIKDNKIEEAQLIYDLKKELGFKDEYFEKKINYLFNFTSKIDETISEKSIFDFYLAHQTNPNFSYEPKETTKKIIWRYLSSANLLNTFKEVEITDLDKVSLIEKAVNNNNYPEKDLFNLYKRFQFNINQLLNAQSLYKSLTNIEGRALIYQKILLESEIVGRLNLLKILKESFKKDDLNNAFDLELKVFLDEINPVDIPDDLNSFYYANISIENNDKKSIKFNNDILHQSKIINYFNGDYSKSKIEKDINNYLKKIKRNKKYFLSKKDQILINSLRSDGIKIEKKYDDLYQNDVNEIPTDIQVMINNNEKGAAMLRIVEVIGQDELERMDEDTISFIVSTLNQLNIDIIRNKILLKVLPLKV